MPETKRQRIRRLVEHFKSHCDSAWIKYSLSKNPRRQQNLWQPHSSLSEVHDLLNSFIMTEFHFSSYHDHWVESDQDHTRAFLETLLSRNLHGHIIWPEDKAAQLAAALVTYPSPGARFFCSVPPQLFFALSAACDPRAVVWTNGCVILDQKELLGIWVSIHFDPYTIMIRPDDF